MLQAHARILGRFPDALLILGPRHPERFRAAISLCRSYGFRTSCRSEDHIASLDSQCFVVDTMGELLKFYACADACFVGGSLDRIGGHNVLEPAALPKPILVRPHTFNFAEAAELAQAAGAAQSVADMEVGCRAALAWVADPVQQRERVEAAEAFAAAHRGACERTVRAIKDLMAKAD